MTITFAPGETRHWDYDNPALDPATGIITVAGQEILRPWSPGGARSTVIHGDVATGKTVAARWLATEYMRSGIAVTWVADPPAGQSLPEMPGNAAKTAAGVDETLGMLWSAYSVMRARRRQLEHRPGLPAVLPASIPHLRVVIDDAQLVLSSEARGGEATWLVEELLLLGRAARIGLDIIVTHLGLRSAGLRETLQSGNVIRMVCADGRQPGYMAVRDGRLLKVTGRAPLVTGIAAAAGCQAALDPVSAEAADWTFQQIAGE